jgi:hypothetical protein
MFVSLWEYINPRTTVSYSYGSILTLEHTGSYPYWTVLKLRCTGLSLYQSGVIVVFADESELTTNAAKHVTGSSL